jgi:Sigma-70 region 2
MAKAESFAVLHDIQTIFQVGTNTGLSDAQLLDRFRARSDLDSAETAFAGLIARHGRMVLGVCRRALQDPDDVADAFQATFLILVRKADTCGWRIRWGVGYTGSAGASLSVPSALWHAGPPGRCKGSSSRRPRRRGQPRRAP